MSSTSQETFYQSGERLGCRNASTLLDARPLGLRSFELKAFAWNLCHAVRDFHDKNRVPVEAHGALELASIVISGDDPTTCSVSLEPNLGFGDCSHGSGAADSLVTVSPPSALTVSSRPSSKAARTFGSNAQTSSAMSTNNSGDNVVTVANLRPCSGGTSASGCCSCGANDASSNSNRKNRKCGCSTGTNRNGGSSTCSTNSYATISNSFLSCGSSCMDSECGHGTSSGGGGGTRCTEAEAPSGWCRAPEQLLGLPYGPPAGKPEK
ncbi:hypothetical protein Vretifemale_8348 [Volvox reticuliferus]|uniref:Uncharacterized protein n=1 Tax=Volvox reticuliferus TaxID=1737510 RepID=A0A8J4FPC7_9CHLO|nr:hypothetical protein Vretifemale_8348 [Volvox reticuliferus]